MRRILLISFISVISASFFYCSNEFSVSESGNKSDSDVNSESTAEFVGQAPGANYAGCDITGLDLTTEQDIDRDGVIDKCDNFVIQRPGGLSYMYADESYYFGYKVWGTLKNNPGNSSEATFVIYNHQTHAAAPANMTVSASVTGDNASNFEIVEGVDPIIAKGSSDSFTIKIKASDTSFKSASLHLVINSSNYYMGLTGNTLVCHGSSVHCERRYNQVSFAATHNSHANQTDWDTLFDFVAINQSGGLVDQLNDGIRGMMIDTYLDDGKYKLCHGTCTIGQMLWVSANVQISSWLGNHPSEIVTFILEDGLNETQTKDALVQGGLWNYIFKWSDYYGSKNTPGATMNAWPTLGWMIENNKRLVVTTSRNTSNYDWYLDEKDYGWQNEYNDENMQCGDGSSGTNARGVSNQPNYLFVMNHFKTSTFSFGAGTFGGGDQGWSRDNNAFGPLYGHASNCWLNPAAAGDPTTNPFKIIPNHVTVDWYSLPNKNEILNVVNALNNNWSLSTHCVSENKMIDCATDLAIDGTTGPADSLASTSDVAWFRFQADGSATYRVRTYNGTTGSCDVDTNIQLYDKFGRSVVKSNNNCSTGGGGVPDPCSCLSADLTPNPVNSFYFIKVTSRSGDPSGALNLDVTKL